MTKQQITSILKINGLTAGASPNAIREVLTKAKYSPSEIDEAMTVLRQATDETPDQVDGLYTVFYSDKRLNPKEISNLLQVDVAYEYEPQRADDRSKKLSVAEAFIVTVLSLSVSAMAVMGYMYINQFGMFSG